MKKLWKTASSPGVHLEKVLNKLTEEGWNIEYIFEHGVMPVQTSSVIGSPNQTEVTAIFTVIAAKLRHSSASN